MDANHQARVALSSMCQPKKEQKENSFLIRSLQIYKEIIFRQSTPLPFLQPSFYAYELPHTPELSSDRIFIDLCTHPTFPQACYSSQARKTDTR